MPTDEIKLESKDSNRQGKTDGFAPEVVKITTLTHDGLFMNVSEETNMCLMLADKLWDILNVIPSDKIEKFEWDFILKSLGDGKPVLEQNESDFLFVYLDKSNTGDITKPELRSLLELALRNNDWDVDYEPTYKEIIQRVYEYALNDEEKAIRWQLELAVIKARNDLTRLLDALKKAKYDYSLIDTAMVEEQASLFTEPQRIFDRHLKEHQEIIEKFPMGTIQGKFDQLKKMLDKAEKEYKLVDSQIKKFVDQANKLEMLEIRDAKCCKVFGCLCPF